MNKLCPRCEESNDYESSVCKECGFSMKLAGSESSATPADLKTLLVGTEKVKILSCVECNYPLRDDSKNCPNCGLEIISGDDSSDTGTPHKDRDNDIKETIKVNEVATEDKAKTIIQNYEAVRGSLSNISNGPETVLQSNLDSPDSPMIVPESDLRSAPLIRLSSISLNGEDGCDDINIDTAESHLGRDDIDSSDNTISKKHIRLFRKDDDWYIENQASNKATFSGSKLISFK